MGYCAKCGQEIQGDMKFCKACGAPISTPDSKTEQQVMASSNSPKSHGGKVAMAIMAVIVVIAVIAAVNLVPKIKNQIELSKVPDYERPLKIQADAINDHDFEEYLEAYSDETEQLYEATYLEQMQKDVDSIESMEYEIIETYDCNPEEIGYCEEYFEDNGFSNVSIEEEKILTVKISCKYTDDSMNDYWTDDDPIYGYAVIKIDGKWYTLSDLAEVCTYNSFDWEDD